MTSIFFNLMFLALDLFFTYWDFWLKIQGEITNLGEYQI